MLINDAFDTRTTKRIHFASSPDAIGLYVEGSPIDGGRLAPAAASKHASPRKTSITFIVCCVVLKLFVEIIIAASRAQGTFCYDAMMIFSS